MRTRATSAMLAGLLLLSLTGCTFGAVQANQQPYEPSDGVSTTIGDIKVRNALLVTDDGESASLVVNILNDGDKNIALKVSWEADSGTADRNVYVRAGSSQSFAGPPNQIVLNGIDATLGGLFPVYFQYGGEPGDELMVPVLDGELAEYADLLPDSPAE